MLQEFQAKGGRLTLPVGCYQIDDWLLDAVNVPKLLNLLQTGRSPFTPDCTAIGSADSVQSLSKSNLQPERD